MENTINVKDRLGKIISKCSKRTADKLIRNENAIQISEDTIQLKITAKEKKMIKKQIFKESNNVCYICGATTTEPTIDHVIPKHKLGPDDKWNLKCSCKDCNAAKGSMTLQMFIKVVKNNREEYPHITSKALKKLDIFCKEFFQNPVVNKVVIRYNNNTSKEMCIK
jgi:5-methylcytosine-specific restriction endonuclease McrA